MSGELRARIAASERVLVVVAGPNGAGKSTFVTTFLSGLDLRVVNPDAIARALSSGDPNAVAYEAAAVADGVRHDLLSDNSSAEEPYRFVAELRSGRVTGRGKLRPEWWLALRVPRKLEAMSRTVPGAA